MGTIDDHEGKRKTIELARTHRNSFVLATVKLIEKSILYSSTLDARKLKIYIQEERPHHFPIIDSVDLGSREHPARSDLKTHTNHQHLLQHWEVEARH